MSADYYATTIVGVRVPTIKLFRKQRVKAFEHDMPKDWSVHPKTGKPLWKDEETFLLEGILVDDYDWRTRRSEPKHRNALAAIVYAEAHGGQRGDYAFIGRCLARIEVGTGGDDSRVPGVKSLLDEQKFLENLLDPHGLWSEREFGIWLVGDVSC